MNHPSKDIKSTKGEELEGRRIALCVTGSVAAIKSPEVARELMRHGAEVTPVMSRASTRIIHPYTMEWATGNPPITRLTGALEHVGLVQEGGMGVDLVLVAPASVNTIGKVTSGIMDTPVTALITTAIGAGVPVVMAPAMHEPLFAHPILEGNVKRLKEVGVIFIEPRVGEGKAKIAEVGEVVEGVIRTLYKKSMRGLRVLVTSGPTVEHIDPIRIITNKSSGKMGSALANEALRRGAEVTYIHGPTPTPPPQGVEAVGVEGTGEMFDATIGRLKSTPFDILIAASAAADYTPTHPKEEKIPSRAEGRLNLELKATPKIIDEVKKVSPPTFLVAFKAEFNLTPEELLKRGKERLLGAGADLIVVNDVGRRESAFGSDTTEVFVIDREGGSVKIPLSPKPRVAGRIMNIILEKISSRRGGASSGSGSTPRPQP